MWKKVLRLIKCVTLFAVGAALLVSCSPSKKEAGPSANFQLDTKNLVEKKIPSAEGGAIALKTDEGASIKIVFPQGSLEKDSTLVAAPLVNQPLKDSSMKGFSLEEKGAGKGPLMKSPAFVVIALDKELPTNTSIVRLEGASYQVIPTAMKSEKGKTFLSGTLDHFSVYTTKMIDPLEVEKAKLDEKDLDWVIYVNDTHSLTNGPMKQSVTLNLTARNMSGNITGPYVGSATAQTTNDATMTTRKGTGTITAPFVSKSSNLKFEVGPYLPPLTPVTTDPNLAPLETEDPDFSGFGSITMSSSGVGTVTAGGYSASGGASNTSTVPIEVNIIGPQVRLVATLPQATLYFNGYIRGEGRAEPIAPLVPSEK
jgi:hypothetical protein